MIKDNKGIYPEIRESYAAAFQDREVDIMDCKDSEGVDIKQGDLNEPEIPEPLEFIGVPTSVSVSKEEEVVGMREGSEAHNNQSYKSLRIRRSFQAAEWEDNDNQA